MPLIAVAPYREPAAVWAPGAPGWPAKFEDRGRVKTPQTYDWREPRGSKNNTRGVDAVCRVFELRTALEYAFETDAYALSYVMHLGGVALETQPRVSKTEIPGIGSGASWIIAEGYEFVAQVMFADIDNPGHATWTDDAWAAMQERLPRVESLRTCGVYRSSRGLRVVQPLLVAVRDMAVFERMLLAWLGRLSADGLSVDAGCKDWTRFMRLPFVKRKDGIAGLRRAGVHLDLSRMTPIAIEPAPEGIETRTVRNVSRGSAKRIVTPQGESETGVGSEVDRSLGGGVEETTDIPEKWLDIVDEIAEAVRGVRTEWHTLFLALSGALLARKAEEKWLPAFVGRVAVAAGDTRVEDRVQSARSTIERVRMGSPSTGLRALRKEWPEVADAVLDSTMFGDSEVVRGEDQTPLPSVEVATENLCRTLWELKAGVTLVGAECGLGKTAATINVAAARAEKGKDALRAPPQSKTGISVPTNELAKQVAFDVTTYGVTVLRVFGVLSVKGPDQQPVCRYYETARSLQEGGQSIPWELCEGRGKHPCEYKDSCPAAGGQEGDPNARVIVGPHAMLGQIAGSAGTTGLVVVDEPPEFLESTKLTTTDLTVALQQVGSFDYRFSAALRPVVIALQVWLAKAEPGMPAQLEDIVIESVGGIGRDVVDRALAAVGSDREEFATTTEAVMGCAKAARKERKRGGPPLRWRDVDRSKRSATHAVVVGRASRVFGCVDHALHHEETVIFRVDEVDGVRSIVATGPQENYERVLKRDGATVLMDAGIERHAPVVERVIGYEPAFHRFAAADGAEIKRFMLRTGSGNKKGWWNKSVPRAEPIARALLRAMNLAGGRGKLAIVSWKLVRLALEATLDPTNPNPPKLWREKGNRLEDLRAAQEVFKEVLAGWDGPIVVGHYFALRGLNSMSDCDALITLGDPWSDRISARNDSFYVDIAEWEERYETYVAAELEQAHGRLRTIHRKKPATSVHVGNVVPGGAGWKREFTVFRDRGGVIVRQSLMTPSLVRDAVARLGGTARAAELVGCTPRAMQRYMAGARVVSTDVSTALERMLARRSK